MKALRQFWSRRPRLTRNGLYVLTLAVMAAQVAYVTGNNLFWFLFSTGAALLASNAWLGWRGMRKLSVRRVLPQTAFAWESFAGSYQVTNRGHLPAFFVIFEDLPVSPRPNDAETRPIFAFAAAIPPRSTATVPFVTRLAARGWNRFRRIRLTSNFPFGFFHVTREVEAADEVLVYPRVGRVLRSLPMEKSSEGQAAVSFHRPQPGEDDFAGLHEWRPGDNPKAIHWPSWGRVPDKLLVREYERTRVPRACLLIDRQSHSDRRFEQVVSFAAANLLDLHKNGVAATLWTGLGHPVSAAVPEALLSELAEIRRTDERAEELEAAVDAAAASGDLPVVVGDGTRRRYRNAPWAGRVVLVDVAAADFRGRYQVRPAEGTPR
jgi:uncharacterized protein (DUF58 family)